MTNLKLEEIQMNIIDDSLKNSRELMQKYGTDSLFEKISSDSLKLLDSMKYLRTKNTQMSDSNFFQFTISSFISPVVNKILEDFANSLSVEKKEKLKNLLDPKNIVDYDKLGSEEKSLYGKTDMQASSEKGIIIYNLNELKGNSIEEKLVSALRSIIHEIFHIIVTLQNDKTIANTRLFYDVAVDDDVLKVHFAPGKYGQLLNEGFVEKLSSEFAQKNHFFYTLNPTYVQYVNLANYILNSNPNITAEYLFSHNISDVLESIPKADKERIEIMERMVVFNHFQVLEVAKNPYLKGINSKNVIDSYSETNDIKSDAIANDGFKVPFLTAPSESFNKRSKQELKIAEEIRSKNEMIQKQNNAKQKQQGMARVLKKLPPKTSIDKNNGTSNILIISIILSILVFAGLIYLILIKR